jgi:hypothetical protein
MISDTFFDWFVENEALLKNMVKKYTRSFDADIFSEAFIRMYDILSVKGEQVDSSNTPSTGAVGHILRPGAYFVTVYVNLLRQNARKNCHFVSSLPHDASMLADDKNTLTPDANALTYECDFDGVANSKALTEVFFHMRKKFGVTLAEFCRIFGLDYFAVYYIINRDLKNGGRKDSY